MGRKHNDVFVLGPEPLDFDADFESGDDEKANLAARARHEPGATAGPAAAGSEPKRGLGHRPLSGPAATRPNPADRLIGHHGRRLRLPRRAAAIAAAAGVASTLAAAGLISSGGGDVAERASTSPAAELAQVGPTPSTAPPAPVVASPRPRPGAGPRSGPERQPRARPSSQSPSEVPPQPVAPIAAAATAYPTAEAFGFER